MVEKTQSLNELFVELSQRNIHVVSMRNKANRLEELFLSMTRQTQVDTVDLALAESKRASN